MPPRVRAAGAVLWRPTPAGRQYCVVHRPRYDDWSLPKGKLHRGEHPLVAAVREVAEETGVRAYPQCPLPLVSYRLPDGVPKTVDFWLLRAAEPLTDTGPTDTDEVDAVRWLPLGQAAALVSYRDDARLLHHVGRLTPVTATVPLVRHGHAGTRDAFPGADPARPLDARGRAEATRLGEVLAVFAPQRLLSASPLRCRQTVQPLAARLDLPVAVDRAFDEPTRDESRPDRVAEAAARLRELLSGDRTVVCSQGKLIAPLLAALCDARRLKPYRTPKGTGWVLSFTDTRLTHLSRL